MAKNRIEDIRFTNELKIKFLNCDTKEKLDVFLSDFNTEYLDNFGNNILHYYLNHIKSFSLDWRTILFAIIERGIDFNKKQLKGFGRSPLHLAVFLKEEEISEYLIKIGADINSTDTNGNNIISTAVMWYRNDNPRLIELLIKHNANIHQKNNSGVSAISLAKSIDNYDVLKLLSL